MPYDTAPTKEQFNPYISSLHLLCTLGWTYLSPAICLEKRGSNREVLLKSTLIEILRSRHFVYKGEIHSLSSNGIDQIVRELSSTGLQDSLLTANERLYQKLTLGITVTEFMVDGKKHQPTIALIDWQNPQANRFEISNEVEILSAQGTHTRTPNIVCFVNGIPLVVIESKQPASGNLNTSMIAESIKQHLHNQHTNEIPLLFAYAQLLIAINQTDGRYGTLHTTEKFWARWKDEEFDEAYFNKVKNTSLMTKTQVALLADKQPEVQAYFKRLWSNPMLLTEQDRLFISLLTPIRLLEFIRFFVLFDRKVGKLVARHQQFFGIRALLNRISLRRADGGREGGVLWHTTGSGKSFTMVFLTKALILHDSLKDCRVIVVTDRLDLEEQLSKNFMSSGAFGSRNTGEKSKARSGRDLARRIGSGSERIIFTLIHKFNAASKMPECFNPSHNLIILIDEGHRSHNGETHERMRRTLPRAAYIAFTGTPLLKREKTTNKFGPIIHVYTMQRAVEDETVTPLLYEERVPEIDLNRAAINRWFDQITLGLSSKQKADLKRKFANQGLVNSISSRLELIAWDIAVHFNENFKKLYPGLKGQLVTASKLDAIRYNKALNRTGLINSAVIISAPDIHEGNDEIEENALSEVQQWWKDNIGHDQGTYERHVLDNFSTESDPDLLIVVDRLLTGFDEPANAVLYIDKPLKEHNLIQAIARVNRLHQAKRYGVLVDYRGILKELDTAIHAYRVLETQTQGGYALEDIQDLYRQFRTEYSRLPLLHAALWAIFDNVHNRRDMEQFRQILMPKYVEDEQNESYDVRQKLREDFYQALTRFGLCLQTALSSRTFFEDDSFSEKAVNRYKRDLRFFTDLRQSAKHDALETVGYSIYEEQIRRLVDKQTHSEIRESEGVYLISSLDQDMSQWSEEKIRNETDIIRTRLRKTIALDLATDPYAQKVFGDLLKQTINEAATIFEHPLQQYVLLKNFEIEVEKREVPGMPHIFGNNHHARVYFGIFKLILGDDFLSPHNMTDTVLQTYVTQAIHIDQVVQMAIAENSLNPQNTETAIRKALLPTLFTMLGMEKTNTVLEQIIQITHIEIARGNF